jgi:CheY-like chemotaxis protein
VPTGRLHIPRCQALAASMATIDTSFPASGNAHRCRELPSWRYDSARYPVRCVIIDDSADFIEAARRLLEHDGINVVGVASTSAEALRRVQDLRPDLVLVDVDLGRENGFELAEQLHQSGLPAPPPVIMISAHNEQDLADLIAASPAVGFVPKLSLSADAIRDLLAGSAGLDEGNQPVS